MKKVLYIVTQPEFGGAQRYVFELANNFKENLKIIVATGNDLSPNSLLERCEKENIETYKFKHLFREINILEDLKALKEILEYIKKEKPDIVHLNSTKAGILGTLACYLSHFWIKQPKTIYTVHGWAFLEPISNSKRLFYLWAEKISAKFRDCLIVLSEKEKDITLEKRLSHPSKINVIPHGIDYNSMSFFIKEKARNILSEHIKFNLEDGDLIIGTVANLYPTKGLEFLIKAAKDIPKNYNNRRIIFIVIGEGSERKRLETLIKHYGLENSFFLAGSIPEAYKIFWALDIFVLPSVKEGLPYVILESMFAGLPIVATRVGGIPEVLEHGVSGILIQSQNPDTLKNAILELVANPKKRQLLGEQAKEKAILNYTLDKCLFQTINLYKKLLD